MNRYFLKVNSINHCAGAFGQSRNVSDWEGGVISLPASGPVYAHKGKREAAPGISKGDEVWVWTHESEAHGKGRGLSAKGIAASVDTSESEMKITLRSVELVPRHLGYRTLPRDAQDKVASGSRIVDYIHSQNAHAAYLIEDDDYPDFVSLVKDRGWAGKDFAATAPDWAVEVQHHEGDLRKALTDRKLTPQKPRVGQPQFRKDLITLYKGRCAVTKCAVPEALEAAHVMPHTGDLKWDHAENGLLLRRDLHALFDALLWSIDPDSSVLVVADRLRTTSYVKLEGRTINHGVASALLAAHFRVFKEGGRDD